MNQWEMNLSEAVMLNCHRDWFDLDIFLFLYSFKINLIALDLLNIQTGIRIIEYLELEVAHKDHRVQLTAP